METREAQQPLAQALQVMLERLCSPNMTIGEAKGLRRRVFDLLEMLEDARDAADPPIVPTIEDGEDDRLGLDRESRFLLAHRSTT